MRNHFSEALYAAAKDDPSIYIVVSDISPAGSMEKFRNEFPERFINVGVAEQSMIGIAAGLALKGCRPFTYTIATFSLYRPFEFIRDDLCYQNLPVTIVGMGAGITYSTLGSTHHAQEDIAIASAIPNMRIIAPCDPLEVDKATAYCARESDGPVYLRLGKAGEPALTADAVDPWEFGKLRTLRTGRDICILSYGPVTSMAFDVAGKLEERGVSVSIVSVHTLKPLDKEGIRRVLADHDRIIVIEEHAPIGGLGPWVKEVAWDCKASCDINVFALKDEFIHFYGDQDGLRDAHGLSVEKILKKLM